MTWQGGRVKVRFALWLPVTGLAVGAVLIGAGVLINSAEPSTAALPLIAAGVVCLLVGLLYLGPIGYFAVRDQEVVGPVMLGRIPRTSLALDEQLAEDAGRLIIVHRAQEPTRLGIYRWMARRPDWERVLREAR